MQPDEARDPFDQIAQQSAHQQESLARLDARLAQEEERMKQSAARHQELVQRNQEAMQRQQETLVRLDTLDPKAFETTIAQARRLTERDVHPTWMQAAYADLAQRLARVEGLLEELGDSMSLLHTKMETIIGQLAIHERQDRGERP